MRYIGRDDVGLARSQNARLGPDGEAHPAFKHHPRLLVGMVMRGDGPSGIDFNQGQHQAAAMRRADAHTGREVLDLMARGLDNHAIAARLYLSEKTVRNIVSTVFAKTGTGNRAAAGSGHVVTSTRARARRR